MRLNLSLEELEAQFLKLDQFIDGLCELWNALLPTVECPSRRQVALWLTIHSNDFDVVRHGITRVAVKNRWDGPLEFDHAIRYASSCMNTLQRQKKSLQETRQAVESRGRAA